MSSNSDTTVVAKTILVLMLVCVTILSILLFAVPNSTANDLVVETAVIKQGMSGNQVKEIQTILKDSGYYSGNVDGIYGSQTTAAVKKYQAANGLIADGIVGQKTAEVMGISLSSSSSSNSNYNGSDVNLLAKCIYAEARGEPYTGMVAVAAVVLNRVKHPDFPNSIAGVVYQPWAFSSVHDGQINLTPNEEAKRAAQDAINGYDPTNGCIYFYNPARTTNKWIWSRPVQLVIGKHRFAI